MKTKFTVASIKNTFLRRLVTVLILPVIAVLVLAVFLFSVLWDVLREAVNSVDGNGSSALRFLGLAAVHNWLGNEAIKARNEQQRKERVARMFNRA